MQQDNATLNFIIFISKTIVLMRDKILNNTFLHLMKTSHTHNSLKCLEAKTDFGIYLYSKK